jgi:hypothetical protein
MKQTFLSNGSVEKHVPMVTVLQEMNSVFYVVRAELLQAGEVRSYMQGEVKSWFVN